MPNFGSAKQLCFHGQNLPKKGIFVLQQNGTYHSLRNVSTVETYRD